MSRRTSTTDAALALLAKATTSGDIRAAVEAVAPGPPLREAIVAR